MTGTSPADGIALTGWILTCAQDDEQASRVGRPGLRMSSWALVMLSPLRPALVAEAQAWSSQRLPFSWADPWIGLLGGGGQQAGL
jgi:hypothetical protein